MADIPSIPAWNPGAKEGLGRQRMPLLCRWAKFPNQTMNDEDLIYWYIYNYVYIYISYYIYIHTLRDEYSVYGVCRVGGHSRSNVLVDNCSVPLDLKKWKAKKSCRLVHMAEIDLHFQQSKSHVHEYFRPIYPPNLPQCWLKYPYRPILLV